MAATAESTYIGMTSLNTVYAFSQFPSPHIAEQEAIAEALSDADALIESLEQLIAKKRQVKQGAMQELLTGKRRLPGFSGEWEVKRLGKCLTIRKLADTPSTRTSEYQDGQISCVSLAQTYYGRAGVVRYQAYYNAEGAAMS